MSAVRLLPARGVRAAVLVLAFLGLGLGRGTLFALPPKATDQITVRLGIKDNFTPVAVTDLAGAASFTQEGNVVLFWTAPDEDNMIMPAQTPVSFYQVRYATFGVTDLGGDTTAWWTLAVPAINPPSPPQVRSEAESMLITGLEPGATFYFGVRSVDDVGHVSLIDDLTQSGPQASALSLDVVPPVVSGLNVQTTTDTVTLSWNPSTATDVMSYRVYWDTLAPADVFVPTVTLPVGTTFHTFTGLTTQNTYFFYVTALDKGLPAFTGNVLEGAPSAVISAFPTPEIPIAPTGLVAIAITSETITWQWTDNAANEDGFRIYSSTGGLMGQTGPAVGIGGTPTFVETNLVPNTSQTRIVRSYNVNGESLPSNTLSRYTLATVPGTPSVASLFISSMSLTWPANGSPAGTQYNVHYSTYPGFTVESVQTVFANAATLTGLFSHSTYYLKILAVNGENVPTAFGGTNLAQTFSFGIQGLIATPGSRRVQLDWLDNTDPDLAGYFIFRATNVAGPFTRLNLTPETTSAYLDTGLINGLTYYFALTTIDLSGLESPFSAVIPLAQPRKPVRPQEPTAILGSLDDSGQFTLKWTQVKYNVDRTTDTELESYRIYKASSQAGPFWLRDSIAPSNNRWLSPDLTPPAAWYLVRARDTSGNISDESFRVESAPGSPLVASSIDNTMQLVFSNNDTKMFSADTNKFGEDLRIEVKRNDEEEKGRILTAYEIKSFGADTGNEIKDLSLPKPTVELRFRFTEGLAGSPLGAPALPKLLGSVKDVGVFWHNNVEFVKFGGTVDEVKGTVGIKTAKPLGRFQVRQVLRANELTLSQLTPRKIFTPNGDGVNDDITLFLENPKGSVISQAKIYDLTGAEVADFEQGIVAGANGVVSLKWNGRDGSGNYVRSGVFIYQIQAEGKVLNGTLVVAR